MNPFAPDPNNPRPTPDNPNPAPVHPPAPPETPQPDEPPGVPSPSPDPIPSPDQEPIQIPPETPPEIIPSEPGFPAPSASRALVFAAATLLCWTGALGFAAAQTSDENGDTGRSDPCQVEPGNQNESTERSGAEGGNDEAEDRPRPSLEECNGVLTPPKTGDQEIEERPPDTGTTPVIPPGAVPEQSPD